MAEPSKGSDRPVPGKIEAGSAMRVDKALVRELAEMLNANDLNEIEVEDGDRKIKVRRDPAPMFAAAAPAQAAPAASLAPAPVAEAASPQEDIGGTLGNLCCPRTVVSGDLGDGLRKEWIQD